MHDPRHPKRADRDWYSISVVSIRRTVLLLLTVVAGISGAFAYQQWQASEQARRAAATFERADGMALQIEERADFDQVRREFFSAWEDLEAGRQAFEDERYAEALDLGARSVGEFERILGKDQADAASRGRFLTVTGNVEYRRGERGAWKRARPEDVINAGDWVKTSAGGSAEILFPDGSEYVLRANTMVNLSLQTDRFGRSEQVADMKFGWVELSTQDNSGTVKTPKSSAKVEGSSEAMVAFDQQRNEARIAAYSGSVEVTAENGQSRKLRALEQVVQAGDLLSQPSALPQKPRLNFPPTDRQFDLADGEIRLSWRSVAAARSYKLQISRSPLFASNIIEADGRPGTSARLGLRAEGVFYWQVAAVGPDDVPGPWSAPRSFQVARLQRSSENDDTPPPLFVEDVQTYGRLLIIAG
ncbi:MAG: FecR domain-containing protein, partial [Acidobacteriota bacterium]